MAVLPIITHHEARPATNLMAAAEALAERIQAEQIDLVVADDLRELTVDSLADGPVLHLDDLSTIALLDRYYDVSYAEDRARLRAGDGDVVASCSPEVEGYESYCRRHLGLGAVSWLHPREEVDPLGVAAACWSDRSVREAMIELVHSGRVRYLHPHMGCQPVWTLARLLRQAGGRALQVIAPPPALTRCVNDKIWLATTVSRLFGERYIPPTTQATSLASLARIARGVSATTRVLVIKVPDSAGGHGSVLMAADELRGRPLEQIQTQFEQALRPLGWRDGRALLVGRWEDEVLVSPSSQLWIPPENDGLPVVEGLYEQQLSGAERCFVGARPTALPDSLTGEIVDRCFLLARLFQRLGYVGRCSFDLIVVGSPGAYRTEFVECNGRWGGTSLPMTLMNRLFGDWTRRVYAAREVDANGLEHLDLRDLLAHFERDLYDVRSGSGRLVFFSPGALGSRSGIDVLAVGDSSQDVDATFEELSGRLAELARRASA